MFIPYCYYTYISLGYRQNHPDDLVYYKYSVT